jgi:hypothetical protein
VGSYAPIPASGNLGSAATDLIEGNMSANKHGAENKGSNSRDHKHPRHHFLKHAHKDWRVWIVVMVMIAMIIVYVMTDDLSRRPGAAPIPRTPAANAP